MTTVILRATDELRRWRDQLRPGARVGFVPTMGSLHEGHLSLIREARRRVPVGAGHVVLSIFVNPTQFGPDEDLDRYPRDEAGDLHKAREAGADVAFCPLDPNEMFPASSATWVEVPALAKGLCGASRPGHFRGVCTVVTKLWNLVRPDVGVFGQKDYQQLAILRRLHRDLFLCGELVGMPIVREPDGLAMSSRNANLSPEARVHARAIPQFIAEVRRRFERGARARAELLAGLPERLEPGVIDYVALVDAATLEPVDAVLRPALVAVAVHFAGVRLIDNTVLTP